MQNRERKPSYRKRLSVEGKIISELLKKQPQKKKSLCESAGVSTSAFHRILPLLKAAEIIKETEHGFALWTYVDLEKETEDVLARFERTRLPVTLNRIASEIGVSPSEVEKVIYLIVKRRGLEVHLKEGEKVVDRKSEGIVVII